MTTDNCCFYLQNRQIPISKQEVNGTVILPPLVFLGGKNGGTKKGIFCRLQKTEYVLADFIFNTLRPKLLYLFAGRRLERRTSQVQSGAVLRVVPHSLRARPQDPL